jgi:hypothetical protein
MRIVEQLNAVEELNELIQQAETQEQFDIVHTLLKQFLTQTNDFEAFDELWKEYNYKAITRLTCQLQ